MATETAGDATSVSQAHAAPQRRDADVRDTAATEIIFEVTEAPEGGYCAHALGYSIFTEGDDWDDLREMARDAVRCHFGENGGPRIIRLHFVRQELLEA